MYFLNIPNPEALSLFDDTFQYDHGYIIFISSYHYMLAGVAITLKHCLSRLLVIWTNGIHLENKTAMGNHNIPITGNIVWSCAVLDS